MTTFCEEVRNIYRLKIPFDTVYTSVFLIKSPSGTILVDCATTTEDVDEFIVPSLRVLGYAPTDIKMLVLTHTHGDHAGGLKCMLRHAPAIEIVTDIRTLADGIYTYPMGGHTEDSIGILDERTGTLISGDGLQGAGVDKYRCYTESPEAYLETIERIQNDERIGNILFSHAYEPWNSESAIGRHAVDACLSDCIKYINGGIK